MFLNILHFLLTNLQFLTHIQRLAHRSLVEAFEDG